MLLRYETTRTAFPETHWSIILRAGEAEWSRAEDAFSKLCEIYWRPLYAFARRSGAGPEDAQDWTQGFFEHICKSRLISKADSGKGRFRSFLLGSFKNFIGASHARNNAQKRGGLCVITSLDGEMAEELYARLPGKQESPDDLFERSWAVASLDRAMELLALEYDRENQRDLFKAIAVYLQGERGGPTYAQTAASIGRSPEAVKSQVFRMRQRYREILCSVVGNTVDDPLEINDELRYLLQVLSR